MHNAAFRTLGMDWTYELLDVSPDQLRDAVSQLRAEDVGGANVTIPYKQAVMDQLDTLAPEALRARAVNTIVKDGGRLGATTPTSRPSGVPSETWVSSPRASTRSSSGRAGPA